MGELERELPMVLDGQVPLGELLSRVMQTVFAELSEMAETLPNSSDTARKRMLADWVVKTKKQIVKLYAVAKWSRDADTVQKCMNITAFLMDQNRQFEDAIVGLNYARESLDPARWLFVHVEFLLNIGGDMTGTQEDVADAPLVRLFNFLQMMALSYQLEILWCQAERMRSLGWGDYLTVSMSPNRKVMSVSYWVRKPPPQVPGRQQPKLPLLGGTVTISIIDYSTSFSSSKRSSRALALAELQQKSKLGTMRPSDVVEGLKFEFAGANCKRTWCQWFCTELHPAGWYSDSGK
ncbi:hypothetical protein MPER_11251 [Moniliophthora perniciosa FA553]|nr:hypothetical protein MPER_11251 [Moniliophthora perniciosa FA553]